MSTTPLLPNLALDCYRLHEDAPEIAPAQARRGWMDRTNGRAAYRCTPLTIANATGWEVLCPFAFEASWNGRSIIEAITLSSEAGETRLNRLASSHFGHGILTFHLGWLLRTPPGWAVWARGLPNLYKDGITPLEGVIETDWLPFTFTMNWRFTRPGRIAFTAGEPFCFLTVTPHGVIDHVVPQLHELSDDLELRGAHERWKASRQDFQDKLDAQDDAARREGWQRKYLHGEGAAETVFHIAKRRLPAPEAAPRSTEARQTEE
jgi:hypothetical protein